ncbi:hypothetical protein F2Q70_00018036 [Brassica cretica]|uniref:YDG domain-containing protein n=1 Tax=Brassica cretica TaxID=69181 RepID=A0A8S9HT69_BRACR|nr:hypothetical protein F2Q70_00018036 [Brassica cretica]
MNEMGSTSKRGNFEGSFKDVDDDVTRESQRQVVTIPGQSKSAKNRERTTLYSSCALLFCFETMRGSTSGCVNQRQAGPSTNAYAVSPSSQAGPSKAASFATRGNLSFTERAELQRLSSPPPALRYRRSKDDDALRNKRQSQTHSGVTIPLMERDLCPREKVSKARRLFKMIFKELLVDVEAKRTTRIDHDVRMMLKEQNMCVAFPLPSSELGAQSPAAEVLLFFSQETVRIWSNSLASEQDPSIVMEYRSKSPTSFYHSTRKPPTTDNVVSTLTNKNAKNLGNFFSRNHYWVGAEAKILTSPPDVTSARRRKLRGTDQQHRSPARRLLWSSPNAVSPQRLQEAGNANAVYTSSQAGPSKSASFATRGNLSFTDRVELQRLSSPPPTSRSLWTDTNVQRYAAPSPQANAVYPSTQAGPSKAANANALKNKNLQASQQPTQAYPVIKLLLSTFCLFHCASSESQTLYRRSKYDDALRNKRQSQTHSGVTIPLMERDLCPREKVSKARRLFKMIFKELLVDVEAKRTTRIDHDVRMMLKEQNMCVYTDYRVGEVPGILVGDEFEYKTEMSFVGLHFGMMCGIDYMEMSPGLTLGTSIVASEGSQYSNVFKGDQLIYSRVGKGLLKGNMALVNSMKHKAEVRVIRGFTHGNKQMFVYLGLYVVKSYSEERGTELFKFLLETA